jgi:hypothetical protein
VPRLYRPAIPTHVKCRVALRAVGEIWVDEAIKAHHGGLGAFLDQLLFKLAGLLGCEVKDLRLDHDPALALRKRRGEGKNTVYTPAANDPEFLRYRPHGTQFAGSHDVKTRIRGDNGQYSDIVLIKRERRRNKKRNKTSVSRPKLRGPKRKWPSRPFPSRRKP